MGPKQYFSQAKSYIQEQCWDIIIKYCKHEQSILILLTRHQGPLLLTWFNFNPSMDK